MDSQNEQIPKNIIHPQNMVPPNLFKINNPRPLNENIQEIPKLNFPNQENPQTNKTLVPIMPPKINPPNQQNEAQINLNPVDVSQPQNVNIPQPKNENFSQPQPANFQVEQKAKLFLIKKLGEDSFGDIYLSKFNNSGAIFATKKINKSIKDDRLKKYFEMEIKILKILIRFNHPNILKLIQVAQDNNYYYITTEYVNGGSLKNCLEKYKAKYQTGFNEQIVQYLMKQIISAIVLLHDWAIIHRDLKLENIMVNFDNEIDKKELNMMNAKVKLIDFGCAIIIPERIPTTVIGSYPNMDPKIIEKYYNQAKADITRGYGLEVDIWSLGCLCYELNEGKLPFQANTLGELMRKIQEGKYPLQIYTSKEFTVNHTLNRSIFKPVTPIS